MDIMNLLKNGIVTSFVLVVILSFVSNKIYNTIISFNNDINKCEKKSLSYKIDELKNRLLFKIINHNKYIYVFPYYEMDITDKFSFILSVLKYWFTFFALTNILVIIIFGLIKTYGYENIINAINVLDLSGFTQTEIINNTIYGNLILVVFNCIISIGITIKQIIDEKKFDNGIILVYCLFDFLITKMNYKDTIKHIKFIGLVLGNCIDSNIENNLIKNIPKLKKNDPKVGEKIVKLVVNELEKNEKGLMMLNPNGKEALENLKNVI